MPRPWRKEYSGAVYHVTCRGNGREAIQYGEEDALRFRRQLAAAVAQDGVVLFAWALMDNHYHLLLETPFGNLSGFMQRLNTSYAMYFRYKRARPGHCFQGRYGAKLVKGDDYLLRLTRYIHLNPVKIRRHAGESLQSQWQTLLAYRWSSLAGYLDRSKAEEDVDYRWLTLMHRKGSEACRRAYRGYIRACLGVADDVLSPAYGKSAYAIGDADYIQEVEEEIRATKPPAKSKGDMLMPPKTRQTPLQVLTKMASACGITLDELREHRRKAGLDKLMAIELACRVSGLPQRDFALALERSEHAIGKQRRRLAELMKENDAVQKKLNTRMQAVMNS